jgi:hypothetical protein
VPAHIGEAFLALPDGDPEGSLRDPVTTDPKGEACRVCGGQYAGPHQKRKPMELSIVQGDRRKAPKGTSEVKG